MLYKTLFFISELERCRYLLRSTLADTRDRVAGEMQAVVAS
jgi:hypothetical protein